VATVSDARPFKVRPMAVGNRLADHLPAGADDDFSPGLRLRRIERPAGDMIMADDFEPPKKRRSLRQSYALLAVAPMIAPMSSVIGCRTASY
jgi:hypothetical protein